MFFYPPQFILCRYIVWRFVICLQMGEYIYSLVWFLFQYFFSFLFFLFHLFQLLCFREKTNQHKPLYRIQYKQQKNIYIFFHLMIEKMNEWIETFGWTIRFIFSLFSFKLIEIYWPVYDLTGKLLLLSIYTVNINCPKK